MNILMIAPEQIPVPGNGSVEICIWSIAKQLARKHRVTILSRQYPGLPRCSRLGNLTIARVPAGSHDRYMKSILAYIGGKSYDVIQVDNRPHYMAAVKSRFPFMPVTLFLHSLTFVPKREQVSRSLAKADLIIANSSSLKRELSVRFPRQAAKIRMVHLGVDVARFKPKASYPVAKGSFRVLFAGRVIPRKGVPLAIKAVRLLHRKNARAKLIVVGRGSPAYMKSLRRLARRNGVPVQFTGKVNHLRIHREYARADCFVCPSQKHEAFGLVNVEAMASGVPVVASDIGGIKEIVSHGKNGYLVKAYKRPEAFARHLDQLAANPGLARQLGQQGRKDALARFSWRHTASRLLALYSGLRKSV